MNDSTVTIFPSGRTDNRGLRAAIANLQSNDTELTQTRIAREAGISTTMLSQWMNDAYKGDNAVAEEKIAKWLDSYRERMAIIPKLPTAPEWVETQTAKRIMSVLSYTQMGADIGVVYGIPGAGKTFAVKEYQRRKPNVWHATMCPSSSSLMGCLDVVADAIGCRGSANSAARLHRAIKSELMGTQGLLIIDEAQHLKASALDELRIIQEACNIGLVYVGNEVVYTRMTGAQRGAYLEQLHSRIGKVVQISGVAKPDVEAVLDAWGVSEALSREALKKAASHAGALRVLTKVLRLASLAASNLDVPLSHQHIKAAWADLCGIPLPKGCK